MRIKKEENTNEQARAKTDEADNDQFFTFHNTKIKISEHFAENGKTITAILSDYIQRAASFA